MNYGALETEVSNRLNTWFESQGRSNFMMALPFPQTVEEMRDMENQLDKSRALVQFIDSIPAPTISVNQVVQEEVVTIRIHAVAVRLRGPIGTYDLLEQIKLALIGFRPQDCSRRMTAKKYNIMEAIQNNIYEYMDFDCSFMNVQAFNDLEFDQPIGAPMSQIIGE